MTEPTPVATLSPRAKSWVRLLIAVEISLVVHLALIFGLQFAVVEQGSVSIPPPIEARLTPLPAETEAPEQVLVKAIDTPAPPPPQEIPTPQAPLPPVAEAAPPPQPATPKAGMPEKAATKTTVDAALPEDPTYYALNDVDSLPALANAIRPIYPDKAAEQNIKGNVKVVFLLSEHGVVDKVTVIEETPTGYAFGEAVAQWLKHARFTPSMRKGRTVKSQVVYEVDFDPY